MPKDNSAENCCDGMILKLKKNKDHTEYALTDIPNMAYMERGLTRSMLIVLKCLMNLPDIALLLPSGGLIAPMTYISINFMGKRRGNI